MSDRGRRERIEDGRGWRKRRLGQDRSFRSHHFLRSHANPVLVFTTPQDCCGWPLSRSGHYPPAEAGRRRRTHPKNTEISAARIARHPLVLKHILTSHRLVWRGANIYGNAAAVVACRASPRISQIRTEWPRLSRIHSPLTPRSMLLSCLLTISLTPTSVLTELSSVRIFRIIPLSSLTVPNSRNRVVSRPIALR